MFERLATAIRRLPWSVQLVFWPLWGLARLVAFLLNAAGHFLAGFLEGVVEFLFSGNFGVIMAKLTAFLFTVGVGVDRLGAPEIGGFIMEIAVIPLMLFGFYLVVSAARR